jgi:NAD-dependent DNA ligase
MDISRFFGGGSARLAHDDMATFLLNIIQSRSKEVQELKGRVLVLEANEAKLRKELEEVTARIPEEKKQTKILFAVTGVMKSFEADEIRQLIRLGGGRVCASVSKMTDYLVAGIKLDDGREVNEGKKYLDAMKYGTKIITEDELLKWIKCSSMMCTPWLFQSIFKSPPQANCAESEASFQEEEMEERQTPL